MKTLALTILVLLAIAVYVFSYLKYRSVNTPDNGNLEASIDSKINKAMEKGLAYGIIVGIHKDGKSFIKGYGTINRQDARIPDSNTIFELASVGKLFTVSALQVLCDQHVLNMDATLGELIEDMFTLSPSAKKVTLRELATHTSGFPNLPVSFINKMIDQKNPYKDLEIKDLYEYLKTTDGKDKAGQFKYSNFGMGLLGHVLEIVTGKRFEALVIEVLLSKLNMDSTTITLTPKLEDQLAQGYDINGEPCPIWIDNVLTGAGSFMSNASDMMKFIKANLENDSSISNSLQKMHGGQYGGDAGGIGWIQPMFLDRLVGNRSVIWHNGLAGGYASYIAINTKNKTGLVILTNKSIDVTALGMTLMRQVNTQSWSP